MPNLHVFQQAAHAPVAYRDSLACGLYGQGTCQPRLSSTCLPSDQHVLAVFNPATGQQIRDHRSIQPAPNAIVDSLWFGVDLELGIANQARKALAVALTYLGVNQMAKALIEAECSVAGLGELMFNASHHAGQLERS
ncbi:hypothetical protein TP47_13455 [Xanthomonas citri pv. aurantifolii]|nr:hypothetical protein TP37_07290 [Xanthomonas citri pv. aurantifolii]AMV02687.1 hypothetical protein TP50_09710 [Xanthomonas citri pv. aurantifolii]TBW94852.1 hypothetical protein TP49_18020 [Xanthomonas citri pv. aurantifolii]TBW96665.1 hypothetical protein TP47_13455 [Xanthomonas citri pv. aurantifolii]TBX02975.1 hypothetical protein TP46_13235 [Xanthomonas citri pv. aurantifolii]